MDRKKATLRDVAIIAGVSTATVSRCINNPNSVKEERRIKVIQAIEALDYSPHGAAQALASKRSRTVGAIVPTIDNGIFAQGIQKLQRELAQANFTLLLASTNYNIDEELRQVRSMLSRGIDGLILIGQDHHPDTYKLLSMHKLPFVNLWSYVAGSKYSCIGFDNKQVGRKIAAYLVKLGHKNIAVIAGIRHDNDRATARVEGVRQYLQEQNLALSPLLMKECRYNVEQARQAFHALVASNQKFTAVICGNDILAMGALWGARELGLSVPQDLSITGIDNLELTASINPPLTSINVPAREMGKHAARYIIESIEFKSRPVIHIELETSLVVRETTRSCK